jgi:FixJ family two-component response regulator
VAGNVQLGKFLPQCNHVGKAVMVSDVIIPRMGGPELLAKLEHSGREFAAIFMSGHTEIGTLGNANLEKETILLSTLTARLWRARF